MDVYQEELGVNPMQNLGQVQQYFKPGSSGMV